MAKTSKGKQTTKKEKRRGGVRRQERRFVSQAAANATLIRVAGALAALLLGAGLWAYFYAKSFAADEQLRAVPAYLIAAGAVLMGITIWIGTSSEAPLRVGAPGLAVEKGELRRMPWYNVETIMFESGTLALVVTGKDESGAEWTFKVPLKSHAEAVGWIVKEALDRIPRRVDISDEMLDKLPTAHEHGGLRVDLDPLQLVGKKCGVTGKTISYEPDARVCPRCERVFLKRSVPKKCKCGNSLVHLRAKPLEGMEDEELADDESDQDLDAKHDQDDSSDHEDQDSSKKVDEEETA